MSSKDGNTGKATLKSVAELAGVSLATASRVLSNSEYPVSSELKRKIIAAAKSVNYIPGSVTKAIRSLEQNVIGIIVPTLQNQYFYQVVLGAEAEARKNRYEIMILSSHRDAEQERKNILTLLHNRVMALIIISIDTDTAALENYIACGGKVAILESDTDLHGCIRVETDYGASAKLAADYLCNLGHKNVAFLTSPLSKTFRRQILLGVRNALSEKGRYFTDKDIFIHPLESESDTGVYEYELGQHLAADFLKSPKKYTAIIAINDMTAYGIINYLTNQGVRIPEDISIVGFDNLMYSGMISPALTTVELPSGSMGASVCGLLIRAITYNDDSLTDAVLRFNGHLIERASAAGISR